MRASEQFIREFHIAISCGLVGLTGEPLKARCRCGRLADGGYGNGELLCGVCLEKLRREIEP